MAKVTLNEETNARLRAEIAKLNAMMTELYADVAALEARFTSAVATDAVVCTTETITITGGIITGVAGND